MNDPRGFWAVLGAFLIWGLFPIYWRAASAAPSLQLMAHRVAWCFVIVTGALLAMRGTAWIRPMLTQPRLVRMLVASSLLIAVNWFLYIWGVNNGHIVETSLGYFINPLVNVLLGVLVLGETLNPRQWLAVAIAAASVLYLGVSAGAPPWIALALAFSFGTYGLIRKLAVVDLLPALGFESGLLVVPAAAYLVWVDAQGVGAFGHVSRTLDVLLVASGLLTAVPLVLFAYGARRIPYSAVGVIQYVGPSLQLACGVLLFGEPFTTTRAIGFGGIWLALAIYAGDSLLRLRRAR